DDCADVLLGWLDAGLITVMTTGSHRRLDKAEARALLADPAGWDVSHSLVLTDHGEELLDHPGVDRC
ncbi:MAG TPA: hypothetical protein VNS46_00655, partial [Nocardioides sp.]|nr:hypothetical protein [Nocardioides sp.]